MRKVFVAVGILVLLTASTAQAQSARRPWVAVGLGGGFLQNVQSTGGDIGLLAYGSLRLLGTDRFVFRVDANIKRMDRFNTTLTHAVVSPMAYLYPSTTSGFPPGLVQG